MIHFQAYGTWWAPYNQYQGWVIGTVANQQLIQTIRTGIDQVSLQDELGFNHTDKPWQVNVSRYDTWDLTWNGIVDVVHPYEGSFKTVIQKPLLIDPHLGIPVDRYWAADQYRSALPDLTWKFNPWDGSYRSAQDIANDPYGALIA